MTESLSTLKANFFVYRENPALRAGFSLYFGANTIVAIAPIILQDLSMVET